MSREEFGVEKAKEIILQILSERGYARWRDFEERLPKATISRALKELEASGLVAKRGKHYVLVTKQYDALIRGEYAPALCELIPSCVDFNKLADDLIKEVGEGISKIEEVYNKFFKERLPLLEESGVLGGAYSLMLRAVYQNKAIFAIMLIEVAKLVIMAKLLSEGCYDIVEDLPKEYADFLKKIVEDNAKNIGEFLGVRVEEALEPLMRLRNVLIKHGYTDIVRIKVISTFEITLSVRELTTTSILTSTSIFEKVGLKDGARCILTLFDISDNLFKTGCRPLGEKEKENLTRDCGVLIKALSRKQG
ncbi:MAG: hypothetical protein QW290_08275 [Sulfolobales archaeon]